MPHSPAHDDPLAELARGVADGRRDAAQALAAALAPRALGVARRILGPGDPDVEDAAQDSLVAVLRALGQFRGECSVVHYATRIAARTCLERRRRARERGDVPWAELALDAVTDESAAAARRRQAVRELVAELPVEQAETLLLRVVLGMSLPEVAAITGAPVNTVRSRIRIAKQQLRSRIEGLCAHAPDAWAGRAAGGVA